MQYGEQQRVAEKTVPVSKNGLKTDFRKIFDGLGLELDGKAEVEENDWVITSSGEGENVVLKPRRINNSVVPNVKGMGLRDALFVLENAGLKVGVVGAGMVQRQSLAPGQDVREGGYIQIELR